MAKWADFCIVSVKYGRERSPVVEVQAMPDTGSSLGQAVRLSRQSVVASILKGTTFVTAYRNNGNLRRGEDVRIVQVSGQNFLRTDGNQTQADNLGNLPEYL